MSILLITENCEKRSGWRWIEKERKKKRAPPSLSLSLRQVYYVQVEGESKENEERGGVHPPAPPLRPEAARKLFPLFLLFTSLLSLGFLFLLFFLSLNILWISPTIHPHFPLNGSSATRSSGALPSNLFLPANKVPCIDKRVKFSSLFFR